MTLTPFDALIVSPIRAQDRAAMQADFDRTLECLERGDLHLVGDGQRKETGWVEQRWLERGDADRMARRYGLTPVLRDGSVHLEVLPDEWRGRSMLDVAAEFLLPTWMGYTEEAPQRFRTTVEPPWDRFLTSWERIEAGEAKANLGRFWLERRKRRAVARVGRVWWRLRGKVESGDPRRYQGYFRTPRGFVAYLGWPAYLVDIAGETTPCAEPACPHPTTARRRYCADLAFKKQRDLLYDRHATAAVEDGVGVGCVETALPCPSPAAPILSGGGMAWTS